MLTDKQEYVKLKKNQMQHLYHLLMVDITYIEYQINFDDLKKTAMRRGLIMENDYAIPSMMEKQENDIFEFFADRFLDSQENRSSQISTQCQSEQSQASGETVPANQNPSTGQGAGAASGIGGAGEAPRDQQQN